MRKLAVLVFVVLAACAPSEKEVLTTSVDVAQSQLEGLFDQINSLTENELDTDKMLQLAVSTPMDEEQQDRFAVTFNGSEEEIQLHIWREQVDWVHLYFSSTSKELVAAVEESNARFAL
jgi:hypothetical protein